ncbi:uncharacterized protein F5891DRAFT_1182921 [Suillus fuscotomentosus]|uniref:Uncharacterized protein n=1 Tax=Suillus fuscotomentosus TaxID=1912939 RepID=A0AAD4EGS6_9AGAM|nr:uncharacterized protein F5891DRAFT_1182921 [Suillus fuscotomentosus]KAG1905855.1 hypothetical protein F5891DRAFT_1182921 [Suillus fuscotomentosus]
MAPTEAATSDVEMIVEGDEEMDLDYLPSNEDEASDSDSELDLEIEDHPTDSPTMASGSSLTTRLISVGLQSKFGPARLPMVLSYDDVINSNREDLWRNIQFLYGQNKTLFKLYSMQSARLAAAEAHCTLTSHQVSMLNEWLANKTQKKRQKLKKINARFVTHPELKEAFEAEEIERTEKEKVDAEKAAQKKAENDLRLSRIEEDIKTKVFDGSLSSYKRKDDLIIIAGALSLPRDRTMIELTARIKDFLAGNPECASQPRFVGLLGGKRASAVTASAASNLSQPQNFSTQPPHPNHKLYNPPTTMYQYLHPHTAFPSPQHHFTQH